MNPAQRGPAHKSSLLSMTDLDVPKGRGLVQTDSRFVNPKLDRIQTRSKLPAGLKPGIEVGLVL